MELWRTELAVDGELAADGASADKEHVADRASADRELLADRDLFVG